jgi:hypothetical protein
MLSILRPGPNGPSRCIHGDGAPVTRITQFEQLEGPEGASVPGLFLLVVTPMRMTRDWWAVLLAAVAAVLVKLGLVEGVPW